jgi:hypothetical protein
MSLSLVDKDNQESNGKLNNGKDLTNVTAEIIETFVTLLPETTRLTLKTEVKHSHLGHLVKCLLPKSKQKNMNFFDRF